MLTIVGATTIGPESADQANGNAVAAGADGNVYFNFTGGGVDYTSLATF
jgi:hypothetical protein